MNMVSLDTAKRYVCDFCGAYADDVFWKEIKKENGKMADMFVCMDCYFKLSRENKKTEGTQ